MVYSPSSLGKLLKYNSENAAKITKITTATAAPPQITNRERLAINLNSQCLCAGTSAGQQENVVKLVERPNEASKNRTLITPMSCGKVNAQNF